MIMRLILFTVLVFSGLFSFAKDVQPESEISEQQIQIAMRQIGHEMLLASGDSTTIVLPIEKSENSYRISFKSEFELIPESLISIVDYAIDSNRISNRYVVEVEACKGNEIVYSYKKNNLNQMGIPCKTRNQPKGCYSINITFLDRLPEVKIEKKDSIMWIYYVLGIVAVLVGCLLYFKKKNRKAVPIKDTPHLTSIGAYNFDKRNMTLTLKSDTIELTSKEADLLTLLHNSANEVVSRDVILKSVWGDEGDYVGRTLDVFISKLRKKLTNDENVRIVNVRGVGYKLIIVE